jgi:hypothetical protein
MKEALAALITLAVLTIVMAGYFFLVLRNSRVAGVAFAALGAGCVLVALWLLLYAGPSTPHVVYGLVSLMGAGGFLTIGISTLVTGGPRRRR